jgi:chitinase
MVRAKLQSWALTGVLVSLLGCGGGGGGSPPSTPAPSISDTTAPSVPANLQAMAPAATQVQLNWGASTDSGGSGLAGYRVYRNGSTTPLATPTVNSYTDNSVAAGTAYSYRVSAIDAANAGQ